MAIDLQILFDGFFIDPKITHSRLSVFAKDAIFNMIHNNPGGIYDDSIDSTQAAIDNLDSIMSSKTGDKGSRKGETSARNIARRNIEIYCANRIGWARTLFGGKKDARFIATFPKLTRAFYNVPAPKFEDNIEALIGKAHLYSSVLGTDFETDLTTLFNAYSNADASQGTFNTAVRTDIVNEKMDADVLSDQLSDNALLIARNNRKSQTAAKLYFNVDLLYPHTKKEIHKGKPAAHSETEVCPIKYSEGKSVHIYNTGACRLSFGMKLNGIKVGETTTLEHGEKSSQKFDFYFTNGTSIYVENDTDIDGMYQLNIVP